jgi:hypothetical protein
MATAKMAILMTAVATIHSKGKVMAIGLGLLE